MKRVAKLLLQSSSFQQLCPLPSLAYWAIDRPHDPTTSRLAIGRLKPAIPGAVSDVTVVYIKEDGAVGEAWSAGWQTQPATDG